ncbi:mitochondrial thiamine pyrophosphate transporter, partial [Spiromyces aspiralis]
VQGPHRARLASGAVPIYRNSVLAVMAAVVRDEGVAALFKGLVPALIKAGPTSAVMFLVYGQTRDLILYLSDKGSEDRRSDHDGGVSQ